MISAAVINLDHHRRGRARKYDRARVRAMAAAGVKYAVIANDVGCSYQTVRNILKETEGARTTRSRWATKPLQGQRAGMPPFDHPALMEGRTIYPASIRNPRETRTLKSGENTAKIGGKITKGKWQGFPIYTLTLEERATCPRTCKHWRSCFGNKMHLAERMTAGPDLEWRLEREVAALELAHPRGFAIRLHNLGDFYSVEYVELWRALLAKHVALHCFGYSARWQVETDPIAAALVRLVCEQWDRFAIRFSNAPLEEMATVSIEHPYQKPADAVVCPEQVGQTESCSTCGLCWQTRKRVAFVQH